jgi:hypothetical protein
MQFLVAFQRSAPPCICVTREAGDKVTQCLVAETG